MEDPIQPLQDILQPWPDLGNNARGIPLPPASGRGERCRLVPSRSALGCGSGPFPRLLQHLNFHPQAPASHLSGERLLLVPSCLVQNQLQLIKRMASSSTMRCQRN